MRGRELAQEIEPEDGKLGQHLALVRDAGWQDVVEGRNAVGGDDQQPPVDAINVTNFAAPVTLDAREVRFQNGGIQCGAHDTFRFSIGGVNQMITPPARLSTVSCGAGLRPATLAFSRCSSSSRVTVGEVHRYGRMAR